MQGTPLSTVSTKRDYVTLSMSKANKVHHGHARWLRIERRR